MEQQSSGASGGGGFRQRLGTFLQNLGGRTSSSRPEEAWKPEQTVLLTEEIIKEIGFETPLSLRIRAIKEFQEIVTTKRLEQFAIQAIWLELKDLLEPNQPTEARHSVLSFLQTLISGQYEELGILRAHFFRVIQIHTISEDFQHCFDVVYTLTDSGKDIQYIEQDLIPYLVKVFPSAVNYGRSVEYLTMLVNLIKYNSSYIEDNDLIKLIHGSCQLITSSNQLPISELSLEVIDSVVCYSSAPAASLVVIATTLCHTMNVTPLQKRSLEIMLRLLGTHVGHMAVFTLCSILQERSNWNNPLLLRGAVFCISMSLWGSQKVDSLKISFSSVLPFIQIVSKSEHTTVIYEISLSLLRLVRTHVHNFNSIEWETLYMTLENIQEHLLKLGLKRDETNVLVQVIHEIFDKMSTYHDGDVSVVVNTNKFFTTVSKAISLHQLPLIIKLVTHEINNVMVGSSNWVEHLFMSAKKFYEMESVTVVRLHVLDLLKELINIHLVSYETELLQGVVFPLLSSIADDDDEDIRCRAIQLLIAILIDSAPKWTPSILAIINTVLQKGLQMIALTNDKENLKLPGSKAAVFGLTPLLKSKLCCSSDLVAQVFHLLINYLQQQIEEECFIPSTCVMRIKIFNGIMCLRANSDGMVGYCDDSDSIIIYSPFYICEKPDGESENLENYNFNETYLNCGKIFSAVLSCITKEREWAVLVEVLVGLNKVLADRKLTLSSLPDLSVLCQKLCHIVDNNQKWIDGLVNVPSKPNHDLITYLYPILATLCTYRDHLDRAAQNSLICSLERGVVGSCGLLCIRALSVATLEMHAMMARLLPRILYRIGQVVATPTMAIPVLELLANIIGLPSLYSGFVEQQYLGVFGIAIPYMDISKYKSYVVAMAHHVIVMWFIKCRIQYRPTVAKFINKSLTTLLAVHKTSGGSRRRSVSFTSATQHFVESRTKGDVVSFQDDLMDNMTDICIDMMARYTFSNVSTQPIRSPAADFLVGGGPSKTWLFGNALVTITTSGTGGGVQGVCPRCKVIKHSLQPNPDILLASNELYHPSRIGSDETLCSCWCRGWAEIKVRRPTGNVAWLMRIQNKLDILATPHSDGDYDRSLLGLNRSMTQTEEEEEEDIVDYYDDSDHEWGIIERNDIVEQSHDIKKESHEQSHDLHDIVEQSHDIVKQSHDTVEQSHDIVKESRDTVEQSHDIVKESHDIVEQSCDDIGDQSHDSMNTDGISFTCYQSPDDSSHDSLHDLSSAQVDKGIKGKEIFTRDTIPPRRQQNSRSWSEGRDNSSSNLISFRSQSICSTSLQQLPPLFSYDEGHLLGRSPSLVSEMLSDPEQLELMTSLSKITTEGYEIYNKEPIIENSAVMHHVASNESFISFPNEVSSIDDTKSTSADTIDDAADTKSTSADTIDYAADTKSTSADIKSTSADTKSTTADTKSTSDDTKSTSADTKSTTADTKSTSADTKSTSDDTKSTSADAKSTTADTNDGITSKKVSFTPTRTRKRVMFSQGPPVYSSQREDMPTDIFNNPSFIFLQLYHTAPIGTLPSDTPLLLPSSENIERALKVLDHIPPYNTHKIGVVYVGMDQTTEQDILSNTSGSYRYLTFVHGLGQIINLSECMPSLVYLGGLETNGTDGKFSCFWEDDITQVMFHISTLMPTNATNPQCSNKKLHIGNDFVTIVYNDSNRQYQFGTIKGQFNYVEVIIEPLTCGMNNVTVSVKDKLDDLIDCTPSLVSDKCLPLLVRQKALLANLACLVILSESDKGYYPSNWLGRLRQINHIRDKVLCEVQPDKKSASPTLATPPNLKTDFTSYC